MDETLQLRCHGDAALPAVIYLPGTHGDWTLAASLRAELAGRVRFVEITYPRTTAWTLEDYARAVDEALAVHGITRGWLLGESFSSQVCWTMLALPVPRFRPAGLILAGGFVRYPVPWALRFVKRRVCGMPTARLNVGLKFYRLYALWRRGNTAETRAMLDEFMARRTEEDRLAAVHRLQLIETSDVRPIARAARLPVFYLTGLVDPIVPWPFVRPWLRDHCPGFREWKLVWNADHNVLNMSPKTSAEHICRWMQAANPSESRSAGPNALVAGPPH